MYDQSVAKFTGVCLDQVTATFPTQHLHEVELDIQQEFAKTKGNINNLPKLPKSIGGDVDFVIGIKYLRYYPEKVFQLPSGLTVYRSMFKNTDGSIGVIGGPHRIFNQITAHVGFTNKFNFISNQYKTYLIGYQVNPDVKLLGPR